MSLSKNIKRFRLSLSLTQAELANKIGVDSSAVSQWENEITVPRMKTIHKLAEAFQTTPS